MIPKSLHFELKAINFIVFAVVFYFQLPLQLKAEAPLDSVSDKASLEDSQPQSENKNALMQADFGKLPTYIKSNLLTLKSTERVFEYSGSVHVKQGDMTITCDILEGSYDENNQIKQLIAQKNVLITKGEEVRARSEKAVYDAASATITLTENPELQQKDSVLTADLIRIFLEEDRSTAEGEVRVKLVEEDEGKKQKRKK